ncbi:uncharacterized protein (TIGR02217 family) [Methylosinus sp. sav-2]|uniref:DUF2460 domain-containing protein n=1 Tax=Methylosinus sp. sav-2 TaxID=2485168 RepID=UPI00047CC1EB|nr:DUF2460 domain-containing protein [Methylosinus sp. sav-2]TDX65147.1 uncharacterized protein (TIGR02217 family) [Methylosinus sp. sav-2]
MSAFHEVLFPCDIALGSRGGPERRTDIVTMRSGFEERNSIWANSRRRYNAGYGLRDKDDAKFAAVVQFFEERRGRLYGFRWRDRFDLSSASTPGVAVTPVDQQIGTGNGSATAFQLVKTYGASFAPYARAIRKPVLGSVRVAVNGVELTSGWAVDPTTGTVTFGTAPASGAVVKAGFQFDVPVRFDIDYLEIDYTTWKAGQIPNIPVIEVRI